MKPKMPYIPKSVFEVNKSGVGAEEVKYYSVIDEMVTLVLIFVIVGIFILFIDSSISKLDVVIFTIISITGIFTGMYLKANKIK